MSYRRADNKFIYILKQKNRKTKRAAGSQPARNYVMIESAVECKKQVDKLLEKAKANPPLILSMDFEGVRLGKEGPLTLLQIGTVEGDVFVFDVLATPDKKDLFVDGGLKQLLQEKNIMKIIHDCRGDQCALFFQFGVVLNNVYDTSIAYTTLRGQFNFYAGHIRPKLSKLQEIYGCVTEHKTEENGRRIHEEAIFGKRPLPKEMIEYAVDDAMCLHLIYEGLNSLLSSKSRASFEASVKSALANSRIRDPQEEYRRR